MSGSTNRDVMLVSNHNYPASSFPSPAAQPLLTQRTPGRRRSGLHRRPAHLPARHAEDAAAVAGLPADLRRPAKTKTKAPSRQLFRGLYQGIGIVIVATLPAAGTFFTTYEAAKMFLGRHVGPADGAAGKKKLVNLPQPLVHSAASAFAEMASCVVLTPAEVIKQNAQMVQQSQQQQQPQPGSAAPTGSSSMKALRQLAGGAGAGRKLLSGYTAMVARNLPFTAIQFPIFEHARELLWKRGSGKDGKDNKEPSLWRTGVVTGASAGLAGSFAAVVTTPMDVVKTRMMLIAGGGDEQQQKEQNNSKQVVPAETKQAAKAGDARGGLAVARQVLRERGVPGLFRGAVLRAAWTAVGSGLYLGMYEVSKVWLTRGRASDEDSSFP
ncbi:hypothetical protein PG994_002757 [Apiospora phragmitis]|uniref:Mitochondrial carrier protein n=1 Tax=Apiospora phragmitis TaxID=2905665 RepID=A0ABR1W8X7_9PEZI